MRPVLFALLVAAVAVPALGITVTGVVTGPDTKPVEGASVWLYRVGYQTRFSSALVATGHSGADGLFSLDDPVGPLPAGGNWVVYAWKSGLPLAMASFPDAAKPVALKFPAGTMLRAIIAQPDGSPIAGVRVTPTSFSRTTNEYEFFLGSAPEAQSAATVATDERGQFVLPMPFGTVEAALEVAAPGYGAMSVTLQAKDSALRISLPPAGSLSGKVISSQGQGAGGIELRLEYRDKHQGSMRLTRSESIVTDATGSFTLAELPAGSWYLTMVNGPDREFQIRARSCEVKPRQGTTLELQAEPTVLLRGRMVDEVTGQAAADIAIVFDQGGSMAGKTDAEGGFRLRVLPGRGALHVDRWDGLLAPPPWQNLDIPAAGLQLEDIKVSLERRLEVAVTDEQGRAPKYAHVIARQMCGDPWAHTAEDSCDAAGRCLLKRLSGGEATIRAFSGDLASEPVTLRVGDQRGSLKLVLKPGLLAAAKVRVVYDDGTPLVKQYIGLYTHRAAPEMSCSSGAPVDANGARQDRGLEPGLTCHYTVDAPGCPTSQTEDWVTVGGQTHDFGVLTLLREKGFVAGAVVDETGKPIAGALVFDGTDGPRVVRTTTDDAGRFRAEGLYQGEASVFVRAVGYRADCVWIPVGATDARLVLRTAKPTVLGRPVPLAPPPSDLDTGRKLAQQVLERALTRPDTGAGTERMRLLGLLARLAPDEALMLAGQNDSCVSKVRLESAKMVLSRDLDQGLALLQAAGDPAVTVEALLDVAEANAQTRPDLAKRCLQTAPPVSAQIADVPRRAVLQARSGAALLPFDPATGKALLQAAVADIKRVDERVGLAARSAVAGYLAESDPPAAVALVESVTGLRDPGRYQIIAQHAAREHPDEALAIARKTAGPAYGRQSLLPFLPPDRFEQTRDTALNAESGLDWPILIRLCLSASPDRLPAWIEELRDLLEPLPPEECGEGVHSTGEPETQGMALLALMARRLGYPEAREIMLRAALSRMRGDYWSPTRRAHALVPSTLTSQLQLARVVALMEPKLARLLLPSTLSSSSPSFPAFVAALAELEPLRAVELLKSVPASDEAKDAYQHAVGDVAEALMQSREEHEATLLTGDPQWPCLPVPGEMDKPSW